MIAVRQLNEKYSDELATILSTDEKLHKELSPKSEMITISGTEYMQGCQNWETKKVGKCFAIVQDNKAVGSISFAHKDENTASVGYWIKSDMWGKGFCTQAFRQILLIVKDAGYTKVVGSIVKSNIASKKVWEKQNAIFSEDVERYYPLIQLYN